MLTTIPAPTTINGLPVLESRPLPEDPISDPGHAVLCDRGETCTHERFVTWLVATSDAGKTWRAVWGHYFDDEAAAREDLRTRRG